MKVYLLPRKTDIKKWTKLDLKQGKNMYENAFIFPSELRIRFLSHRKLWIEAFWGYFSSEIPTIRRMPPVAILKHRRGIS